MLSENDCVYLISLSGSLPFYEYLTKHGPPKVIRYFLLLVNLFIPIQFFYFF